MSGNGKDPPDRGKFETMDMDNIERTANGNRVMNIGIDQVTNSKLRDVSKTFNFTINKTPQTDDKTGQKNSEQNSTANKNRKTVLYDKSDKGPFIVYIQNSTGNIGKAHPITIAKTIKSYIPDAFENIVNITSIGKNRVKVELNNYISANKLVNNILLKNSNYEAYIPAYLTRRQGVIKFIDSEISNDEILQNTKPIFGEYFELMEVRRINRKKIENDTITYIPTGTVILTFKGQTLPTRVALHKVSLEVEPYIPKIVQCLKCLRYGHLSTQCKGAERCKNCGSGEKDHICEPQTPKCILCTGEHLATDFKNCPEFKKQKTIKTIMSTENISYRDATNKYNSSYSTMVTNNIYSQVIQPSKLVSNISNVIQNSPKRKRIEGGNPLARAHKEIISMPNIEKPTTSYTSAPQYHNLISVDSAVLQISQYICNLVKDISLNKNTQESLEIIKENILSILTNNA